MKKIMLLAPMFLLTPILFGCNQQKDDVDPCIIASEEKFDEAISFKNVQYAQMTRQYVMASSIVSVIYQEAYLSPTVTNTFSRSIYGGASSEPTEKYVEKTKEKGEDKYYIYEKDDAGKWKKDPTEISNFVTPTRIGDQVTDFLKKGGVTYKSIKDNYDKYRQAYYFETTVKERPYAVIMSFYNNQLNYFSYVYEYDKTVESSVTGITYGPITPELPEVDPEI